MIKTPALCVQNNITSFNIKFFPSNSFDKGGEKYLGSLQEAGSKESSNHGQKGTHVTKPLFFRLGYVGLKNSMTKKLTGMFQPQCRSSTEDFGGK